MICSICPHNCDLSNEGDVGKCLVRANVNGRVALTHYGQVSCMSLDPIEKRPLYHFFPGETFLAVGFYGCNMSCSYCMNHTVSQQVKLGEYYSPKELVELAWGYKVKGIAFTYNEPTVHHEYIMDIGPLAYEAELEIVVKSNGLMNWPYLSDLQLVVDAWNIDLKGDDKAYEEMGGSIAPVLQSIESIVKDGDHLEISYLVVPSMLDNVEFHDRMSDWIANLSKSIPVHILYCYPVHKMKEFYNKQDLVPIVELFRKKLDFVYISNTFDNLQKEYGFVPVYNTNGDRITCA